MEGLPVKSTRVLNVHVPLWQQESSMEECNNISSQATKKNVLLTRVKKIFPLLVHDGLWNIMRLLSLFVWSSGQVQWRRERPR